MKILVENSSNLVTNVFSNDTSIELNAENIVLSKNGSEFLVIADQNSSEATLIENLENVPEDFFGRKYTYTISNGWEQIEGWVNPNV